jgi:hypothetical protein
MSTKYYLHNVIVPPEEADDGENILAAIYADIGLCEGMAYAALNEALPHWEEELDSEDEFVESTLLEAIECLKRFHLAWRATVVAQRRIEASSELVKTGDWVAARKLLAEAESMRKGFRSRDIEYTLNVLRSEPNAVRELIESAEQA